MTAPDDRLFCSKPFKWFEVSRGTAEGDVFLCCPAWLDTPVGNLTRQSVSEAWNGPAAQAIRRSVLDGSFAYCNALRCPFLQTISGPVQRVRDVTDPDLVRALREGLTVLPHGPREINCSYDRSCNLSCPSCRTAIIMETDARDRILDIQAKLHAEALAEAHLLYITGSGDPFGSPFFRRWLQTLRRADLPQLQRIKLHTNALLWNPRMWDTIPAEIQALVHEADISIDAATAGTYAVNRRGGRFDLLLRNLEFIGGLRARGPLAWLGINMAVQENNFREIPAFVRLGRRFGVDTVYFQQLVNWGTFSDHEFAARAVHLPSHPRHGELLDVLDDPALDDPIVLLGNLSGLRGAAGGARAATVAGF
jgi:hypothetical protein